LEATIGIGRVMTDASRGGVLSELVGCTSSATRGGSEALRARRAYLTGALKVSDLPAMVRADPPFNDTDQAVDEAAEAHQLRRDPSGNEGAQNRQRATRRDADIAVDADARLERFLRAEPELIALRVGVPMHQREDREHRDHAGAVDAEQRRHLCIRDD